MEPVIHAAIARLEALLNEERRETAFAREAEIDVFLEMVRTDERYWQTTSKETTRTPLKRDQVERLLKEDGSMIYIRKDAPYFISHGAHQATLDLGGGIVAKGSINGKNTARAVAQQHSSVLPFGRFKFLYMKETTDILQEEFSNVLTPTFARILWSRDGIRVKERCEHDIHRNSSHPERDMLPTVYFTKDLREDGTYTVHEYGEEVLDGLPNKLALKGKFSTMRDQLFGWVIPSGTSYSELSNDHPHLQARPHGFDYDPETAIQKMFLLQVPEKGGNGKLVLGDYDHVTLFR
ncbi:MAG: hypothetical protein OXR66_00145 [Candidatus Woesearchaeota archaeon]|nr:hypothetical protein [Candidatus Woesearchaeota archaeon]